MKKTLDKQNKEIKEALESVKEMKIHNLTSTLTMLKGLATTNLDGEDVITLEVDFIDTIIDAINDLK